MVVVLNQAGFVQDSDMQATISVTAKKPRDSGAGPMGRVRSRLVYGFN